LGRIGFAPYNKRSVVIGFQVRLGKIIPVTTRMSRKELGTLFDVILDLQIKGKGQLKLTFAPVF
jgi:hypothetical protein